MWIFLKNSFLSIVVPSASDLIGRGDVLLVRARAKGDIEAVFPGAEVTSPPDHDYSFRAFIDRSQVASEMASLVNEIDAPNFKNSVKEGDRAIAYQRVWAVMNEFQTERGRPGKYGKVVHDDLLLDPAYEEYLKPGRRRTRK